VPIADAVTFSHITMQFPGVLANDNVSLSVRSGEVFALVGENGAGKSTLMRILYGLHDPTAGEVFIRGQRVQECSPAYAIAHGVGMVHQHFMLVSSFTVAQNIVLSREPRRYGLFYDQQKARQTVLDLTQEYGLNVNPDDKVADIGVGLQQRVEILKTLHRGAEILILDEPTAVLTPQETDDLFSVIRRVVKEKGMTVILITHKLYEVMAISDRVGVMRCGKLAGVYDTCDVNERMLASLMVGREMIAEPLDHTGEPGAPLLTTENLQVLNSRGLPALKNVSLSLHAGEILGVAAVEGNGQKELAEALAGLNRIRGGRITILGKDTARMTPAMVRNLGVCHIPEDRLASGVSVAASVSDNLLAGKQRQKMFSLLKIHLKRKPVRAYANTLMERFDIRAPGINTLAGALSGGNMQKVVAAREFSFDSKVLIICQPTRGIDIGAMAFIHDMILKKRREGCAILLISADLDEVLRLSDRVITLFDGQITGEFASGHFDKSEIGYYMTGSRGEGSA
jgi:simple sugar transport system ATP-binding protein